MGKVIVRDISPFLQAIRNFLLGRKHVTALRFPKDLASRSPQPPNLPDGPSHRLHTNYYFTRDGRREVKPPTLLVGQTMISELSQTPPAAIGKLRRPGDVYNWD